ncbi:vitamin K-dependent protein S-like isoform X3 [Saimiri boliviensis]|uniref:vitamin K-dependent protein S-like isoform X3 n=1 Tax=Saimiri boliviensis TaxID=27679 RepID=UPI003D776F76
MVRSLLAATSFSWAQVVLLPQPPKHLGLQRQGLSLLWSARANHHLLQHGPPRLKQSSCLRLQKLDCKYMPPCQGIELEIVNSCEKNNGGCSHHCEHAIGAPCCSCNHGYQLDSDEKTCIDLDKCENGETCCAQLCISYLGGY